MNILLLLLLLIFLPVDEEFILGVSNAQLWLLSFCRCVEVGIGVEEEPG